MQYYIVGSLFIIIIVVAGWLIIFYNRMINKRTVVEENWRILNAEFQKRSDFLEEWNKYISGYLKLEDQLLREIMLARHSYLIAETPHDVIKASLEISKKIEEFQREYGYCENGDIPGIIQKAHELAEMETKIEKYHGLYNDKVQNYNGFLVKFPNIFASEILGIEKLPYFYSKNNREEASKANAAGEESMDE